MMGGKSKRVADMTEAERGEANARARARRAANPERARQQDRARYAANPESKRAAGRAQYAADPEGRKAAADAWRKANLDRANAYGRARYAAYTERQRRMHRSKARASTGKRRASCKADVSNAPTAEQLAAILLDPCLYCGAPAAHVDHFIPLSRGGTHDLDNLVPACAACNLSKGAKLPDVEWTGRKVKA